MRVHIKLDDALVREIDTLAGQRSRSAFIRSVVESAIERERRWRSLQAAMGSIKDIPHEWDDDPQEWVRAQRRDPRPAG